MPMNERSEGNNARLPRFAPERYPEIKMGIVFAKNDLALRNAPYLHKADMISHSDGFSKAVILGQFPRCLDAEKTDDPVPDTEQRPRPFRHRNQNILCDFLKGTIGRRNGNRVAIKKVTGSEDTVKLAFPGELRPFYHGVLRFRKAGIHAPQITDFHREYQRFSA